MSMSKFVRTLLVIFTVVVATVVQARRAQASDSGCSPDIGKKMPVILVHGFLGKPSTWDQMISIINSDVPNVYVDTFDYSHYNKDWVDNPNIGPKLAERIACLATSSRQAGGLGKVIVVAHSMGGLATRFAATEAPNASEVARDLGIVITIGTPNTGSEWAYLGGAAETAICTPDFTVFTIGGPPKVPRTSACTWDALYGMTYHSTQITGLPWLPSSVPLLAIAGDLTVNYPLFHLTIKQDTKGDLVVGKNGALKGVARGDAGGGQATIPCSISIITLVQFRMPQCWHSALTHNQTVELATVNAIKKYLKTLTSTTIPGIEPFVGTWGVGGVNYLIIKADGSATYQAKVRGENAQIQFTSVRGNTAYGMVTSGVVDPVGTPGNSIPTGGNITVTLTESKLMQVSNGVLFCQPSDQCAY